MQIGDLVTLSLNGKCELTLFDKDKENREYGVGVIMEIGYPCILVHWFKPQKASSMWHTYIQPLNPKK